MSECVVHSLCTSSICQLQNHLEIVTRNSENVTLRSEFVTQESEIVTLRSEFVTLRYEIVTEFVTLESEIVTLRSEVVTFEVSVIDDDICTFLLQHSFNVSILLLHICKSSFHLAYAFSTHGLSGPGNW